MAIAEVERSRKDMCSRYGSCQGMLRSLGRTAGGAVEDGPRSRGVRVPGEYRDVTWRSMDAVPSAGELWDRDHRWVAGRRLRGDGHACLQVDPIACRSAVG